MPTDARPLVTRSPRENSVRIQGQTYDMELHAIHGETMPQTIARHAHDAGEKIRHVLLTAQHLNAAADVLAECTPLPLAGHRPKWKPTNHYNSTDYMGAAALGSVDHVAAIFGKPNRQDDPCKVAAAYTGILTLADGRKASVAFWDWKRSAEHNGTWHVHVTPDTYLDDVIRTLEGMAKS